MTIYLFSFTSSMTYENDFGIARLKQFLKLDQAGQALNLARTLVFYLFTLYMYFKF